MTSAELLDLLERVKRVQSAVADIATSTTAFDDADEAERERLVQSHRYALVVALSTLVGVQSELEKLIVSSTSPPATATERH